ncbi:pseudouridine synthase [Brucella grignonensis]|uniref:Pseudouridine synthase n=1 Tax=Brucella grignonensis TaxID=94627 RepID=A0A256EYX6_9HYPH|nr:pseudouridine synthase [Brucella grignonensis]OYR07723.1 pseudouridine synthase family protein [Brucella grignonensis]
MSTEDDNKGGRRPPHGRGEGRGDRSGSSRGERGERRSGPRDDRPRRDDDRGGPRKFGSRDTQEGEDTSERIAKRLARAGIASRREAETMIAAGRISVNGKVLESPAVNVKRTDVITVDGKQLKQAERTRLWLYHKPAGLVTTNRDPEGRPTVFEALPPEMPRVLSVGRLDINTEGLLLLTNDGGLSRVLELPSTGWLRRYRVRAHGKVTQAQLDELKNGIAVDGVFYGSIEATLEREQGANVWISIGLREGKNREVKNILGALGLTVGRLIRVSFGPFQLGDLEEGAVREIRGRILRDQLGEKLVEESGADFDAPVLNEFSNTIVQGRTAREMEQREPREQEGEYRRQPREREWISSQPERRKRPEKKEDKVEPRRRGGVNVWMASGARPQGEKAAAEKAARATARGERASRSEGDFKSRPRRFEDGDQRRDEGREDRSRRFEGRSEGRPASRPPRGEGDFQSRPRRFNDGDQRREEGRDDRPRRFEGRSEGRPEGRYEPRAPRPEGRDDRKQERRPGKRERAELKSGGGERSSGGYEGRSFGKPSGPRSSGPRSGGAEGRGPSKGGGGFGKGPDRGGSGGKPSNGRSGDGKPRGGKPGGSGADRRR